MDFGDVVVPIVIVLLFLLSGLKKILEAAQEQGGEGSGGRGEYEASASEVQDFLRGLEQAQKQQGEQRVQADLQERAGGPRRAAGGAVTPEQAGIPDQGSTFWQEPSREEAETAEREAEQARQRAEKRRRAAEERLARARKQAERERRKRQGAGPEAAMESAEGGEGQKVPTVTAQGLKRIDLKQAVIWSEILGPPVGRRGPRRGHVPPMLEEEAG